MANMLNSFLHPEDAYEKAEDAENNGWRETQNYERPFWQNGMDQYGRLNNAADKLNNPMQLEGDWVNGYTNSPFATQMLEQNKNAGLDAASSMGLMGSSAAINNIQHNAHNIVNQDRSQFLNDLMQKYMAGIGIGQNLYGTGAQMGANLGQQSQNHGENISGLEYGRQAAPGAMFGDVLGKAAGAGINYATGGTGMATGAAQSMPQYAKNALYSQSYRE